MKRRQWLVIALAATGAALAGCGGGQSLTPDSLDGGELEATWDVPVDAPMDPDLEESSRALRNGRRGVQAVILSRWSGKSVDNLAKVLERPDAPTQIEISFAPHFNNSNPYGNALVLADRLAAAGKKVTWAVYLSFHSDANSTTLKTRARTFNSQFLTPLMQRYRGSVHFKLLPSLEDTWNLTNQKEFNDRASVIAAELDWGLVESLDLRRSALGKLTTLSGSLKVTRTVGKKKESKTFTVQREYHAYLKDATGHQAYSNDGVFVWLDKPSTGSLKESAGSADNADPKTQKTKVALTDLVKQVKEVTASNPNAFLLWRPAYNLFTRQTRADGTVFYAKSGSPSARKDSDTNPAFGATETDVLEQYLGLSHQ